MQVYKWPFSRYMCGPFSTHLAWPEWEHGIGLSCTWKSTRILVKVLVSRLQPPPNISAPIPRYLFAHTQIQLILINSEFFKNFFETITRLMVHERPCAEKWCCAMRNSHRIPVQLIPVQLVPISIHATKHIAYITAEALTVGCNRGANNRGANNREV